MGGLGAIFSGPPKPKMSTPENPPDPDNEGPVAQEARKRKLQRASQRGGRTSTILTGAAGGGDYSGGTVG